jgi:hypothetical protein
LAESYILWVIFVLYAVIGVYCLFWIRNDAEFRAGSWAMVAIPAIVLWPIMLPIWLLMRGPEHLTNMAAKQSPRDFQIYMRTKKDKDLFVNFPKQVSAKKPSNNASRTQDSPPSKQSSSGGAWFKDHNIENLLAEGKWEEALKAAKGMRKVAIQTEEDARVQYYDGCIRRIEEGYQTKMD